MIQYVGLAFILVVTLGLIAWATVARRVERRARYDYMRIPGPYPWVAIDPFELGEAGACRAIGMGKTQLEAAVDLEAQLRDR